MRRFLVWGGLFFSSLLVALLLLYLHLLASLPALSIPDHYEPAQTTRILSSDGTVIATLSDERRIWTALGDMGHRVVPALLATEDHRFFSHQGVDPVGVGRALVNALHSGEMKEGASTLTMQLARNMVPMPRDHWERKAQEVLLSFHLERKYGKWEILELYLNQVYFGAGAYGIHSAAQIYFDKTPKLLTLSEATLLVGLIQSPSRFCPLYYRERAFLRQKEVLQRMLSVKGITPEEYSKALAERGTFTFEGAERRALGLDKFPYFTHYAIKVLSRRYSDQQLYRGGLTIQTSLDIPLQRKAQKTLNQELARRGPNLRVNNGAVVVLENRTGFIKAMIGGTGWSDTDQFNRAHQALRQPGSSFKPAVYAAALEAGYSPQSLVDDTPITYPDGSSKGWTPRNSDGSFAGVITLHQALRDSRNIPAVKILAQLGPNRVAHLAQEMGIASPMPTTLPLALGALEVTPLEMASLFSVIANSGERKVPNPVILVKNSKGIVLEDNRNRRGRPVLTLETASALTSMLRDVVRSGTGYRAQIGRVPIAGKTGTTDEFRDAWFCGFSPLFTCVVWVGNDNNRPMSHCYGGDLPASLFHSIMSWSHRDRESGSFAPYKGSSDSPRVFLDLNLPPSPSPKKKTWSEPKNTDPGPSPTPLLLSPFEET